MSKSIGAKVISDLLKLWPKYTEEECEEKIAKARLEGEKPCPPPKNMASRFEDNQFGRIFYINEGSESRSVVFYLHGGAYHMDFTLPHWHFLEKLVKGTDALIIAPAYRLVPFATYREAFDLIVPLYKEYCEAHPDKKVILMGDSAGGGLSLALTEHFRTEGIRLPDELVLMSPWVDVVMDNDEIKQYEPKDPFLSVATLRIEAKHWMDDLDAHDWRVSPIYGDVSGIHNVTVFVGTSEIFYPDVTKFFHMLDDDPSNELIVGEDMNHVYPLFPIQEAKPAVEKMIQVVNRVKALK